MTCTGGIEWMGWTVSTEHGSHRGVTERHRRRNERGITLLEKAQPGWIEQHAGRVRTARTGAVVSGRTARVFPPSRATWCPGAGAPSSWGGTTSCAPLTSARVPTAAEKSRKKWKLHPHTTWFGPAVRRQRSSISDCMSSLRSLLWRANWKGNPRNPSRAHTARRRSDVHQTTSIRALAQTRIDPSRPSPRPNEPGARERRAAATAHTAVRVRRKGALIFQRDDRWRHHLD